MNKFIQEPYRIFFPLGILIGVIGAAHWFFYWMGWISAYSGLLHSAIQIQGYMSCFIIGFLMTAMPRFASTFPAKFAEVSSIFILFLLNLLFLFLDRWVLSELAFMFVIVLFARFAIVRIKKRNPSVNPPVEFIWIPFALFNALIGSGILVLLRLGLIPSAMANIGEDLSRQGYVLAIVGGVGGFLIPRISGRFQAAKPEGNACDMKDIDSQRRRKMIFNLVSAVFVFASFAFDSSETNVIGSFIRAAVITSVLWRSGAIPKTPRVKDLFVWLAWVSVWMVVLGLWLTAFFPQFEKTALHVIFLGGFSLMTFAIGTMVILSHSGQSDRLRKPIFVLWVVAAAVVFALLFRIVAIFIPTLFFQFLAIASLIWIFGSVSWFCYTVPQLGRSASDSEFDRQHEEMKKRVSGS